MSCAVSGCDEETPRNGIIMCAPHWRLVPKKLQEEFWESHRVGIRTDKGSDAWKAARETWKKLRAKCKRKAEAVLRRARQRDGVTLRPGEHVKNGNNVATCVLRVLAAAGDNGDVHLEFGDDLVSAHVTDGNWKLKIKSTTWAILTGWPDRAATLGVQVWRAEPGKIRNQRLQRYERSQRLRREK